MEGSFTEETFDTLALKPELLRALAERGFEKMTPVQAQAIPLMLEGKDLIGQAQTGTGKTAAFGLPILEKIDPENGALQALILCPTRELAVQSANEIRSCAAYLQGVKTLPVYGGQEISRQIMGLKGTQIVVGTPGRIMDHLRRHTLKPDQIRTVILDEADEMLDMGFLEDMEEILGQIPGPHQTAMFSATMPEEILNLSGRFLQDPVTVKITGEELTVPDIEQFWYRVRREEKVQALVRLITCYGYRKCMIFCNTKSAVDDLVSELQKNGCMAEALHGDLSQYLRDAAMKRFRENDRCVLAATDIAARGIDVGDVEAVFNFDLPQEAEYYVHRIGRTGRAGRAGTSHTLATSREYYKLRFIEALCHAKMTERQIPTELEIHEAKKGRVLEEALAEIRKGNSTLFLTGIHEFCNENAVTPEELAAAFLFLRTGKQPEPEEEAVPSDPRRRRRRREEYDGHDRHNGREEHGGHNRHNGREERNGYEGYHGREERSRHEEYHGHNGHDGTFSAEADFSGRRGRCGEEQPESAPRHRKPFPFRDGGEPESPYAKQEPGRKTAGQDSGFFHRKAAEKACRNRDRDENYRWGKYDFIEQDLREEQQQSREKLYGSRGKQFDSPEKLYGSRKEQKDRSFPKKADRKENRERSRRVLAQSVKDVTAAGWAAPRKKRKTPDR